MYAAGGGGGGEDEDEDEGDTVGPLIGKQRRGHVRGHSRALAGTWHSVV